MKIKLIAVLFMGLIFATTTWAQNTRNADLEVTWAAPTTNTDGSPLTDLGGYYLCLSVDTPIPADLKFEDMATHCTAIATFAADVESGQTNIDLTVPAVGTIYARIAAFDTSDNVSDFSEEASLNWDFLPADVVNMTLRLKLKKGKK